jgi:hypothetical protein
LSVLGPDERRLYTECLLAPPGFRFDHGVATTFTLDLETLLSLPFTLAMQSTADPDALLVDRVALLQSLRATTNRLSVFHQRGHLAVPRRHGVFFGLLENCVFPVVARHVAGIFHPKLWILRFTADDEVRLRVIVLSRNLTADRSWDLALVLEGTPKRGRVPQSRELAELVAELPELAALGGAAVSEPRRELVTSLADEVARTELAPPEPFDRREPARFHTLGLRRKSFFPELRGNGARLLCLSPFLSASTLVKARSLAPSAMLVSRDDQLEKLSDAALDGWSCRVLAEAATTDESIEEPTSDDQAERVPSMSLHAKALVVEDRMSHVTWWVGSANLTDAAWEGRNVELMVELHGTVKYVGIDRITDAGFLGLCAPWERGGIDAASAEHEQALERAEAVRAAIVRCELLLEAIAVDDAWNVVLHGAPRDWDDAAVRVWPVSLPEAHGARALVGEPSWTAVATVSLTSILAFEVMTRVDDATATLRFALMVPTRGFPEDRDAHVLRHVVDSKEGFFRYLRLLLAEGEGHLGVPGLDVALSAGEAVTRDARTIFDDIILEDLVRTLSRDPTRLAAVDRVVRDLTSTAEGAALVPREFSDLWDLIRTVKELT